jgi:hypothetical protein
MDRKLVHMSESDWDNNTQTALWCGMVTFGRTLCPHTTDTYACEGCSESQYGTETSDTYAYSSVEEYSPDLDILVPEGWYLLDEQLYLTPTGRHYMWTHGHRWAFEDQKGGESVSYYAYDAQMTV